MIFFKFLETRRIFVFDKLQSLVALSAGDGAARAGC